MSASRKHALHCTSEGHSSAGKAKDRTDGSTANSDTTHSEQLDLRINGERSVEFIPTRERNAYVPQNNDSLMVLSSKMTALANTMQAGESVALVTDYALAANFNLDAL